MTVYSSSRTPSTSDLCEMSGDAILSATGKPELLRRAHAASADSANTDCVTGDIERAQQLFGLGQRQRAAARATARSWTTRVRVEVRRGAVGQGAGTSSSMRWLCSKLAR